MTIGWCFDNTYYKLSDTFKEDIKPIPVKKPELVLLNKTLAENLNLNFSNLDNQELIRIILRKFFTRRVVIVLLKLMLVINLVILQCWEMVELF